MHNRWNIRLAGMLIPVAVLGLSACSKDIPESEPTPAPTITSSTSALPTASTSPTATPTTHATSTTADEETPTPTASKEKSSVSKVAQMYGSLAPAEFFDMFEDCAPNGIPDSSACTGPEVGQFQFFKGDAKAASTTQLLTELRSSRVVEDSGDRIVGWSTLGTTAVITVVDNKKGLTMQQMVSSDKQDPLERIYELGLAAAPEPTPTAEPSGNPS